MPKISVIIPVYNSEKYLKKCLDSVLNQTLSDFEVIAVNDGSTDRSLEILEEYAEQYPDQLRIISQENAGQATARNKGLSFASGEYVFFVDSDDYLTVDACEKAYQYAKENELDIVCFDFWEVCGDEIRETQYCLVPSQEADRHYVLNETSPWNKIILRALFSENGICFTEGIIYEDLELIPRLALYTKKIGFFSEKLYYYVIHENSTMRQKEYSAKLASIYQVAKNLTENFIHTTYRSEVEFLMIEHLLHGAMLRYLPFQEGKKDIFMLSDFVRKNYPYWYKNPYFRKMSLKYRLICYLSYCKKIGILRILLGVKYA